MRLSSSVREMSVKFPHAYFIPFRRSIVLFDLGKTDFLLPLASLQFPSLESQLSVHIEPWRYFY